MHLTHSTFVRVGLAKICKKRKTSYIFICTLKKTKTITNPLVGAGTQTLPHALKSAVPALGSTSQINVQVFVSCGALFEKQCQGDRLFLFYLQYTQEKQDLVLASILFRKRKREIKSSAY